MAINTVTKLAPRQHLYQLESTSKNLIFSSIITHCVENFSELCIRPLQIAFRFLVRAFSREDAGGRVLLIMSLVHLVI